MTLVVQRAADRRTASCPPPTVSTRDARRGSCAAATAARRFRSPARARRTPATIPTQPDGTVVELPRHDRALRRRDGRVPRQPGRPGLPVVRRHGDADPVLRLRGRRSADWTHTGDAGEPRRVGSRPAAGPRRRSGDRARRHERARHRSRATDGQYRGGVKQSATSPDDRSQGLHATCTSSTTAGSASRTARTTRRRSTANGTPGVDELREPGRCATNEINHIDKEWRFQDVDLSAAAARPATITLDVRARLAIAASTSAAGRSTTSASSRSRIRTPRCAATASSIRARPATTATPTAATAARRPVRPRPIACAG